MENEDTLLVETQIKSRLIYDGRIIKLKTDDIIQPDGSPSMREYVCHRGGAAILAVDDENCVYLVRQFRYPYKEVIFEIPAGKLEEGEEASITAERELEEEVGLRADEITPFGMLYPSPGYTDERLHIYLAKGLKKTSAHLDDGEFLNVHRLPFDQVISMVLKGEIHDAKTCYAVLRYSVRRL